ncbi:hypothetical protein BDV95DRAFT_596095 [Massariosphaeria phaeospora]|uniref:Secreted protein n=1 Tax=Massariosphaeria phaeospora TaxID=100035 RepID=A0A7C8ICK1_9PLEO|nr:hypothetical protein BDV95DRAFT_596095 [Massariosphaeria phaeospora]
MLIPMLSGSSSAFALACCSLTILSTPHGRCAAHGLAYKACVISFKAPRETNDRGMTPAHLSYARGISMDVRLFHKPHGSSTTDSAIVCPPYDRSVGGVVCTFHY